MRSAPRSGDEHAQKVINSGNKNETKHCVLVKCSFSLIRFYLLSLSV